MTGFMIKNHKTSVFLKLKYACWWFTQLQKTLIQPVLGLFSYNYHILYIQNKKSYHYLQCARIGFDPQFFKDGYVFTWW